MRKTPNHPRWIHAVGLCLFWVFGSGLSVFASTAGKVLPAEVVKASAAFKTGWEARNRDDAAVTRILLPRIKKGLSKKEVEFLLGPPDKERAGCWFYDLYYSRFLAVDFGKQDVVLQVRCSLTEK